MLESYMRQLFIFVLRLDPEFPFRLNEMELAKKRKNDTYYMNYIRSLQRRLPERRSRSIVQKLLRCSNMPYKEPLEDQCRYCKQFIPLPPSLLYNVKITPKSITLRKVTTSYLRSLANFFLLGGSLHDHIRLFRNRKFKYVSHPSLYKIVKDLYSFRSIKARYSE